MRRWIYVGLSILCVLGLWHCGKLWGTLAGQSLFRMTTTVDADFRNGLDGMADAHSLSLGAFAIGDTQIEGMDAEPFALYECVRYHPEALGVLLIKGSPITREQMDRAEPVIMLSEAAAMRISPDLNLIGTFVNLKDQSYRVVAVYRHYEPLGFLTRTAEASAIIPLMDGSDVRRLYVWLRPRKASPFVFQQASMALEQMQTGRDAGGFQAVDLEQAGQMNKQGIRLWLLLMLSLLCLYTFRALSGMRRSFLVCTRRVFARYYSVKAAVRLIWPFIKYIIPSLAILGAWVSYLAYCANRLLISAQRVPNQLLDPEAWLTKQTSFIIGSNLMERMPVHAYLLNEHLQWIGLALGLLGAYFLWIGLKPRVKREG